MNGNRRASYRWQFENLISVNAPCLSDVDINEEDKIERRVATQTPKDSPSITGFITVLIQEKKTLYKKI